jgi:hypothetical protein
MPRKVQERHWEVVSARRAATAPCGYGWGLRDYLAEGLPPLVGQHLIACSEC